MNGNQIETIDEKAFHRVDINKLWVNNCRNARFCPRDENVRCCYLAQERLSIQFNHTTSYLREAYTVYNPFTPESDQFQISPTVFPLTAKWTAIRCPTKYGFLFTSRFDSRSPF